MSSWLTHIGSFVIGSYVGAQLVGWTLKWKVVERGADWDKFRKRWGLWR